MKYILILSAVIGSLSSTEAISAAVTSPQDCNKVSDATVVAKVGDKLITCADLKQASISSKRFERYCSHDGSEFCYDG